MPIIIIARTRCILPPPTHTHTLTHLVGILTLPPPQAHLYFLYSNWGSKNTDMWFQTSTNVTLMIRSVETTRNVTTQLAAISALVILAITHPTVRIMTAQVGYH